LKEFIFSWSPVAPAIHYNILASNCGICPTTTNHTNVTCTDVSLNGTVCTFAVQAVVCGNITGSASDPISIHLERSAPTSSTMSTLDSMETVRTHTPGTNTEYVYTSTGLLATALMVCVVVFIIVTCIILIRSKAKIKAALQQSEETTCVEPVYEYITRSLPSESDVNTQVNVAYGESDVNTQVNAAYGRTQTATAETT
jgi:hypothetical protein